MSDNGIRRCAMCGSRMKWNPASNKVSVRRNPPHDTRCSACPANHYLCDSACPSYHCDLGRQFTEDAAARKAIGKP